MNLMRQLVASSTLLLAVSQPSLAVQAHNQIAPALPDALKPLPAPRVPHSREPLPLNAVHHAVRNGALILNHNNRFHGGL